MIYNNSVKTKLNKTAATTKVRRGKVGGTPPILLPYREEIKMMRQRGFCYKGIHEVANECGIKVSYITVRRFCRKEFNRR